MRYDVLIDARRSAWNPTTGTGIYACRLVEALRAQRGSLNIRVLEESKLVDLSSKQPPLLGRVARWPRKLASDLGEVPLASAGAQLSHLLHPEGAALGRFVVTVQDLDVVVRGADYPMSSRYYGWRTVASCKRAARVICPSAQTAGAIATRLGRSRGIRVVHLGVDLPSEPPSPARHDRPYFLYSGGFSTRKNVRTLLEAWAEFSHEFDGELVVTGAWHGRAGSLPKGVRSVSTLDREAFWRLCSGAVGLVYPSVREGFGFPVLEGALLGRPVVCGSVGIVPELSPQLVLQVDVHDRSAIADGMRAVAQGWRPDARAVAEARRHFTWQRCAAETLAVYEECL